MARYGMWRYIQSAAKFAVWLTHGLARGHSYCEFERVADSIRFETVPAGDYILFRSEFPPECYYHSFFDTKKNTGVKKLEGVQLGLSKYY